MASRSTCSGRLSCDYQGLTRAGALINLRADDFAEDLQNKECGRKRQGQVDKRCRDSPDAYKASSGCGRAGSASKAMPQASACWSLLYGRPWQTGRQNIMLRQNEGEGRWIIYRQARRRRTAASGKSPSARHAGPAQARLDSRQGPWLTRLCGYGGDCPHEPAAYGVRRRRAAQISASAGRRSTRP